MTRIGRMLAVSGLCATLGAPLMLAACGRHNGAQTEATKTPAVDTQAAPASLPMGGAKSVTTFFATSKGVGRGGDLGGLPNSGRPSERKRAAHHRLLRTRAFLSWNDATCAY